MPILEQLRVGRVQPDEVRGNYVLSSVKARFLPRLPNYIEAFGVAQGVALAWKLEMRTGRRSRGLLSVPFQGRELTLRDSLSDRSVYWQCIVRRQYDISVFPQHFAALRRKYDSLVAGGQQPLIVDGGANIGLASVYLNQMFPRAKIVAIEPDRENLTLLRQNCRTFSDRAALLEGGLWQRNGWLKITNESAGSTAFTVAEAAEGEPGAVPAFCLDGLLDREAAHAALIVKLDIEGAQQHLFVPGATAWIERTDCIILELDDWLFPWRGTSTNFFSEISKFPFDYLLHGEHIVCFNHRLRA
jgi:FkbM family methyltransferase